jgi:hypothetical protein
MEKNISKRVVAGTLALLTVFGSAPATLQGVFAPTALVAQAVDAADVAGKIEYSRAKAYIESIVDDGEAYSAKQVANNNSLGTSTGKIVSITSKVPLVLTAADGTNLYYKDQAPASVTYTSFTNGLPNQDAKFDLPPTYTVAEFEAATAAAKNHDLTAFNSYIVVPVYQFVNLNTTDIKYSSKSANAQGAGLADAYEYNSTIYYVVSGNQDVNVVQDPCDDALNTFDHAERVVMTTDQYSTKTREKAIYTALTAANAYKLELNGAAMTEAAAGTTTANLAEGKYLLDTTGGKYTYSYKATANGVTVSIGTKAINLEETIATVDGGANVGFVGTDALTNTAIADLTSVTVGTTVKLTAPYPFTVDMGTQETADDVPGVWDSTEGKFVATFEMPAVNVTATARDVVKDFTYSKSGTNVLLANSKNTPKDVTDGIAAKIVATQNVKTDLTKAQYDALTEAQKALYVVTGTGKELDPFVYYLKDQEITNGTTVDFGSTNVDLKVSVNENLLGFSAGTALYTATVKKPGDAEAKNLVVNVETGEASGSATTTVDYVKYPQIENPAVNDGPDGGAGAGDVQLVDAPKLGFYLDDVTAAGTYEVTVTVWPTDQNAASQTINYSFTIGASDEISEEDITLTADGDSKLASDTTKNSSACKKGETVEFTTYKTAGVATPVHVTPTLDAKFGLSEKDGDYYFTGADTATEAGTVNTLTLNIVSANYGGSATNPVQIPVKWTLVDPEAADDFTFTGKPIAFNNVADDKTVTPRNIAEIDAEVKAQITNVSGKVKASEITFSYEPVDENGEDDLDREDQGGEGLPKSTGFWKITASWKGVVVKDAVFNYEDNKEATVNVTAVPANEEELSVVFGDTLDISAWKFYVGYVDAEHPGTEVNVDFMEDTELTFKMTPAAAVYDPINGDLIGNHAAWNTVANAYAADQLDLGNVGKKYIQLQATTKRVDAQHTGKNELDSGLYVVTASEFMINVVPKDLSTAVLADIIVSKGAATVVKIRDYLVDCDSATVGNQAYEATDKATGAKFELEVVSGVTIASKVGDYDVEFKAKSDNYTGTIKTKWHVVENAAGFTLDITNADGTTATAELSGLNKVKVEAKRVAIGGTAMTSSTEFGILYGTADDAAAAKEALIYEGAGTTCEIVAGDGIAKTVTDENAKGKFELTVADPDNTWVVAYAKDEGGTYVYSAPYKVDINTLYAAKVTNANLKIDTPVYINDGGTIKAYVYAERPKIEVGEKGKETEITPAEWGVVVSRDGKAFAATNNYETLVLGAEGTIKGTSKGANDIYTGYNYGVKVKVTNQDADIIVKPYAKFADGSIVYGLAKKIDSLSAQVTAATELHTFKVNDGTKAKMRVTRKVTDAALGYAALAEADKNATYDAAKKTYTKTTQAAVDANPEQNIAAKAAVTSTFDIVDLTSADAFGVVVDKTGALATADDGNAENGSELAATKAALVVGGTGITKGASKTPNVASITEKIGGEDYVIGQLTKGYAAYGAATAPTGANNKVTFRGFVTFGNYTFYTAPDYAGPGDAV